MQRAPACKGFDCLAVMRAKPGVTYVSQCAGKNSLQEASTCGEWVGGLVMIKGGMMKGSRGNVHFFKIESLISIHKANPK